MINSYLPSDFAILDQFLSCGLLDHFTGESYVSAWAMEPWVMQTNEHSGRSNIIQIAVSHGSIFRTLQNVHIQAFENPSASVREGCLHGEVSPLEKERCTPHIGVALLVIMRDLNIALDMNNLLSRFMDNLWSSELAIFDLGLTYR
nr:hypothetical protein [Tanacetum cinerariifolium]